MAFVQSLSKTASVFVFGFVVLNCLIVDKFRSHAQGVTPLLPQDEGKWSLFNNLHIFFLSATQNIWQNKWFFLSGFSSCIGQVFLFLTLVDRHALCLVRWRKLLF